jgi:predicted Fe-Mo cluster-binding NifX family protein
VLILVPTADPPSETARVSPHFGRAPHFAVVDTESGRVSSLGGPSAEHSCHTLAAALLRQGVEAVACGGLGAGALASLQEAGIPVYVTREPSVAAVMAAWRAGRVVAAQPGDTCRSHGSGE